MLAIRAATIILVELMRMVLVALVMGLSRSRSGTKHSCGQAQTSTNWCGHANRRRGSQTPAKATLATARATTAKTRTIAAVPAGTTTAILLLVLPSWLQILPLCQLRVYGYFGGDLPCHSPYIGARHRYGCHRWHRHCRMVVVVAVVVVVVVVIMVVVVQTKKHS